MTYSEKLKDPRWQKRRLEILERCEWLCQICGDNRTELHVHHPIYIKGREPWEYGDDELTALCKHCHEEVTELCERVAVTICFPPVMESIRAIVNSADTDLLSIITILAASPALIPPLYTLLLAHRGLLYPPDEDIITPNTESERNSTPSLENGLAVNGS